MTETVKPTRRRALAVPLLGVLMLLAGCAGVTPIGELLDNSSRYDGKTVRIEGEVGTAAGALGVGAYQVRDKTGTLTVLSQVGTAPRTGSQVGVKGRFEALFSLLGNSLAVLREESRDSR